MSDFEVKTLTGPGYSYDMIETSCVGSCPKPYRMDSAHPEYQRIHAALARGDRSAIRCYHSSVPTF